MTSPKTSSDAPHACRLYLITPPSILDLQAFGECLKKALDTGETLTAAVQVRLKETDDEAIQRTVEHLLPIVQSRHIALILNDRPDLAHATGCDGVHIGQSDASYTEARSLVGPDRIVGMTCHDSRHFGIDAAEQGVDYVAFGSFYPTCTKEVSSTASVDLLSWWQGMMTTPCVAIGGITPENARPIAEAGADFLAICSGIWEWEEGPEHAVKRLSEELESVERTNWAS